jgi:AraC-like DNA-binding protein
MRDLSNPVVQLKALIECEYARPLTLKTLAAAVGKERTYAATLFRRFTGQTLHEYLTAVRVRHAGELIRDGYKIEAAMLLVGYRSKRSFYRQFRALTGVTPGAYRLRGASSRTSQA